MVDSNEVTETVSRRRLLRGVAAVGLPTVADRRGSPFGTRYASKRRENTLVVTKDGAERGRAVFTVAVDGELIPGDDFEGSVDCNRAVDWVGPESGTDTVHYTGSISSFLLDGPARVTINGTETDAARLAERTNRSAGGAGAEPSNTLRVTKDGTERGLGVVAVRVSGALAPGDSFEGTIVGATAIDRVGPEGGTDELRFSGTIEEFLLHGRANAFLNGDRLRPDEIDCPAVDQSTRIVVTKDGAPEGTASYFVDGSGLEPGDEFEGVVSEDGAWGRIGPTSGADAVRATDDLRAICLGGPANVSLDGEPFPSRYLRTLPNTITFSSEEPADGPTEYAVTVSDVLAPGDHFERDFEGDPAVGTAEYSRHEARGRVGDDEPHDTLRFSGEITTLALDGPATAEVNGEPFDPPRLARVHPSRNAVVAPDATPHFAVRAYDRAGSYADGSDWMWNTTWSVDGEERDPMDYDPSEVEWEYATQLNVSLISPYRTELEEGEHTVTATVPGNGERDPETIDWTVRVADGGNRSPSLGRTTPTRGTTVDPGEFVEFEVDVTDPDGNLDRVAWFRGLPNTETLHRVSSVSGHEDTATHVERFLEPDDGIVVLAWALDTEGAGSHLGWSIDVGTT